MSNKIGFFRSLFSAVCVVLSLVPFHARALSLELALDNTLYSYDDRFNTASSRFNYFGTYDFAAQGIGIPGISLFCNLAATNSFTDPLRKKFDARTLMLEATDLFQGFDLRVGRQHLYRTEAKTAYLDGLDLVYRAGDRVKINAYGGLNVPSYYSTRIIDDRFKAYSVGGNIGVRILDALWLGACGSDNFDSTGSVVRAGGSVSGRFGSSVELNGLALYNVTGAKLEEYHLRFGIRPVPLFKVTAFLLGEQPTVDSTNPFMLIVRRQHTDAGLRIRAGTRAASIEAHYILRNDSAGIDHIAGLDGSAAGFGAGYEIGTGKRGASHSANISYTRTVFTHWELGARVQGDFYRIVDTTAWNNNTFAVAHAALVLPALRLRICPEFQFITNNYYSTDYRVLLNANYTLSGFWKS